MNTLRVAVNGKAFGQRVKGGAVRVGINLVTWLARVDSRTSIDVFVPRTVDSPSLPERLPPNVTFRTDQSRLYGTGVGRSMWEQLILPRRVQAGGYSVLLNPTNSAPVLWSPGIPQLIVVHDAGFLNREWYATAYSWYLMLLLAGAARQGARFVTVSETSAAQIRDQRPNLAPISVIANDSDTPPADIRPERRDNPYLLFLGSRNPRKNIHGAIEGFRLFAEKSPGVDLLVAGGETKIFRADAAAEGPRVRLLGYVDDERRWRLLRGARLLLFPSFLEGFGLPILEALKVGTPVVASDIPVFQELFGDAVEYVDPRSAADIARGICRVHDDAVYRRKLVERGRRVAERYSWERSAGQFLELLRHLVGS